MALDNLISVLFTDEEVAKVNQGATDIGSTITGKTASLTPDERQQHGRIANQNKLIVDKVKMYMDQNPQWIPGFLDKTEFDQDFKTRAQIESMLARLEGLVQQLVDTKILLDHDNYNNALTFYRYVRYLSNENEPGAGAAYADMKELFARTVSRSEGEEA